MEIKVLVVDDEERQRRSIVRHVEWDRHHMRVIGESEDADGALEKAGRCPPDLLITDIRMLGMDGLELSSRMRKLNPRLRVIMVTGYEEFQYAKTALDIGVDAFLVKPILFDELNVVLDRIYREERTEQSKTREEEQMKAQLDTFKPIAQEQLLQEILNGLVVGEETIRARADALDLFAADGLRCVLTLVVDTDPASPLPREEQLERVKGRLDQAIEAVCGSLLEQRTTSQRGNIVLILRFGTSDDEAERETEQCIRRLSAELDPLPRCKATIGTGPFVARLSQLSESFRLAQRAVNHRLLGGGESAYSWKLLTERGDGPEKSLEEWVGEFCDVLGAGDSQSSLSLLGEILSSVAGKLQVHGAELRSLCLQLVSGAYRTSAEIGDVGRQFGPEKKLWERLLECREEPEMLQETIHIVSGMCEFIATRKKSHTLLVVQKALDHMNERYADNLSLRSVADSVYLSPNYLGALFRTELGISFTDQLIRIRVQKAKEMLQQPELKLYEVAERIGYQNIGYFTSLFKRMTGFSPKEYRDFHGFSGSGSDSDYASDSD